MSYSFLDLLCLLGSVALFLYGMKVMSEGLQKAAGDRLRSILYAMTRNRFTGCLTGVLITALIQSSSASTVMVVSFVNAGLMTLAQSMAVIMGANLGATFTMWLISLFGFKVNMTAFVLPLIGFSIPLLYSKSSKRKSIGEFMIGFAFLFQGLDFISHYVPDLQSNPEMFEFLTRYTTMGFGSVLVFVAVGIVVTAIIQSSAATFAITLIMCSKGWVGFDLSCAIILGSKIGTTITPLMASLGGNAAAKRAAMGHLLFNVLGTLWMLCVFYPFVDLVQWITEAVGQGDPTQLQAFVNRIEATDPDTYNHLFDGSLPAGHPILAQVAAMQQSVSIGLSIYPTLFCLTNLMIMIWFTKLYVKIVERIIPSRTKEDEEFQLKFISGGLMSSTELNLTQAEKEIVVFAERVQRMIGMAQEIVRAKDGDDFTKQFSRLEKYEEISDRMELEIASYLNRTSEGRLSNESKHRIAGMFRIVSEIESIADCCYGVGKVLTRKRESGADFNDEIYHNIDSMFIAVEAAMTNAILLLRNFESAQENDIITSYNREREINNLRNTLRTANIEAINDHRYQYQAGIYYMDIIGSLEKVGDYIINVVDEVKVLFRAHAV